MVRLINRDDHEDTTVMTFEVDGNRGWTLVNQADGYDMVITPQGELITGRELEIKCEAMPDTGAARIIAWLVEYA